MLFGGPYVGAGHHGDILDEHIPLGPSKIFQCSDEDCAVHILEIERRGEGVDCLHERGVLDFPHLLCALVPLCSKNVDLGVQSTRDLFEDRGQVCFLDGLDMGNVREAVRLAQMPHPAHLRCLCKLSTVHQCPIREA